MKGQAWRTCRCAAQQAALALIPNNIAQATREVQVAAEQQLCDMELLPSRLLSTMLARCLRRKTRRASIK